MNDSARTVKLTRAEEQRAEQLYGRKWRQIRRWFEKGAAAGDPCPLFEPTKMPAWWTRHSTWRVPAEIEAAAIAATREELTASSESSPTASPDDPTPPASPSSRSAKAPPPPEPGKSIDLEDFDPEEGDRLRELKQIQAARFADLKATLKLGGDSTLAETKYIRLCETVDKIETRVTERLKKRGLYILREEVERDLAANSEFLRQSHAAMIRRVREQCPSLNPEQRAEVAAAIERARASEERILARLNSFQNGDDLLRELNAA